MGDLKASFAPQHELALYATKGKYEFKGKRPKSVYRFQRVSPGSLIHPNEKPVELFQKIIEDISIQGETVLDLFGGSGASAIACLNSNRNYISIEKDPDYFEQSRKRIAEYEPQLIFN
jgi:site-specific DNA-methyltransferase (adenine-specific)